MFRTLQSILVALLLVLVGSGHVYAQTKTEKPRISRSNLGLSARQEASLRQALRRTRAESDRTSRMLLEERKHLASIYGDYSLNSAKARETIGKINRLQRELLNLSLERQLALRSILSRGQFERLGKRPGSESGDPRDEGGVRVHRQPRLKLDTEQQQAISQLWQKSTRQVDQHRADMNAKLKAIDKLYESYHLDQKAARRLIGEVNSSQRELMLSRLEWQIQVREILSEQQFKALVAQARPRQLSPKAGRR